MNKGYFMRLAVVVFLFGLSSFIYSAPRSQHVEIDSAGPMAPWGKTIGDIDGDGLVDIVVGGHQTSKPSLMQRIAIKLGFAKDQTKGALLAWYKNPSWQRHTISNEFKVRTDLEVGDINRDGQNDVVIISDRGLFWLENPSWTAHKIKAQKLHDLELADIDQDGDYDIVTRNQSLFGYKNGNVVTVWINDNIKEWKSFSINVQHGEGLKVADINSDGFSDIVVNGYWYLNPKTSLDRSEWIAYPYTGNWNWADVVIDVNDINQDGKADIVLSPSEPEKAHYRISWFESLEQSGKNWKEHVVDSNVETIHHAVASGDFDGDGDIDIFTAEMNQGEDPDEVKVYLNGGSHEVWTKTVLGKNGSHGIRAYDFDGDFKAEVFGANWQIANYWGDYKVSLWQAESDERQWVKNIIDDDQPNKHLFVFAEDIDRDGLQDLVTGKHWYKNPGDIAKPWSKKAIGKYANTAVAVEDFNGDGLPDILASTWDGILGEAGLMLRVKHKISGDAYPGSLPGNKFVWAKNLGDGQFKIFDNIEAAKGDYLQGATVGQYGHITFAEQKKVLLSWHGANAGLQSLYVPANPEKEQWTWMLESAFSQDEQVGVADIDRDGVMDITTGSAWLKRGEDKTWLVNKIAVSSDKPDRHVVSDINNDGLLDIVVGYEAVNKKGKLAWYQQKSDGTWDEHIIGWIVGPMSLSVVDMNGDGDLDVVAGEHNLMHPQNARLVYYENKNGNGKRWQGHLISKGEEHHNGALAVDLDKDGDLDVVSIGWGHSKIIVYKNTQH